MTFTPTDEQRDIVDAFASGDDLIVVAGAGAGKTATLMLAAEATPGRRGIYVAYNKALADEAKARFKDAGLNVECRTAHSLAYGALGVQYKHRLNGPRLAVQDKARLLGLRGRMRIGPDADLGLFQQVQIISRTVETFMKTMDDNVEAHHVPRVPALHPRWTAGFEATVVAAAQGMWEDLQDLNGRHYFTHDAYLAMWARSNPVLRADYVMLDESQDASPEIGHIVTSQACQKVAVGDPNQTLYAWRGARDAMEGMPEGTRRLTLSQSFRFGPAVADEANEWLADLGSDLRIKGTDGIDSAISPTRFAPRDADASLHRTNAGAMGTVIDGVTSGLRVAVVGGGKDLRALAQAAADLQMKGYTTHPELAGFSTWPQVIEYAESDDGSDLKPMVTLIARHTPSGVMRAIDACVPEAQSELVVSTAHKAKGREWDRVRIGDDFKAPTDEKITRAEQMLSYVAVTRAKRVLDPGSLRRHGAAPASLYVEEAVATVRPFTAPSPAPVAPAAPVAADPAGRPAAEGQGDVAVTVTFTGQNAYYLRELIARLGYKQPDGFVNELVFDNPFWLTQVAEVEAAERAERGAPLALRCAS